MVSHEVSLSTRIYTGGEYPGSMIFREIKGGKRQQSPSGFHTIENYADCICIHCHKKVEMKQTPGGTFA